MSFLSVNFIYLRFDILASFPERRLVLVSVSELRNPVANLPVCPVEQRAKLVQRHSVVVMKNIIREIPSCRQMAGIPFLL